MGFLLPPHRQWMLMKSYLLLGRNRQIHSYDRSGSRDNPLSKYFASVSLMLDHCTNGREYGKKIISLNLSLLQSLFGYLSTSWYDFIALSQKSTLNSTKVFPVNGQEVFLNMACVAATGRILDSWVQREVRRIGSWKDG